MHAKIASGARKVYLLAKAGYGPGAGNVMLEQKYGDPMLSRDGVSNIRRLYLEEPTENMSARAIIQASSMNNRNVGDGTTAVAILTYLLYTSARKLVVSGYGRMEVAKMLKDVQYKIIEEVEKLSIPFTEQMLHAVAKTSTGDDAIASMLDDIFKDLGEDAGVLVESFGGTDTYSEIVDGFYFNKGFTAVGLTNQPSNLRSFHEGKVPILISEKRLLTKTDIGPLLQILVKNNVKEVILVGECSPEVLEVIAANWLGGVITTVPVDVPYYEGLRTIFMNDLALLTDGVVLTPGTDPNDFTVDMLGYATKVVIDERSTKIIGADGSSEAVKERIKELKSELAKSTSQVDIDAIRERISRLNGKLAILHVGGATEFEREELKLRVDDAISAIRAAYKSGVVPGGGVTLARADSGQFQDAYKKLLKLLSSNSGLNPERILQDIEKAKDWFGYDLRNMTDKPVDLRTIGILDPTVVVTEIVKNATSIASSLITVSAGTVFVDRESKID